MRFIAEGTHSFIFKCIAQDGSQSNTRCLKLFREGWMTPYNLETTAYAYLVHARVEYYIPKVYGVGLRSVSGWGLADIWGESEDQYYGILMEWLEGAQQLSEDNVTIDHAICLAIGLSKIHDAGVLHWDTFPRNILVIPGSKRGVWIDFSCAQIGEERVHDKEMYIGGGLAIEMVNHPRFHADQ